VSARSVARYRKAKIVADAPALRVVPRKTTPVFARFVHHTWMMDVSEVRQFLGPKLHMACVFDTFGRRLNVVSGDDEACGSCGRGTFG
jgi:hypothetical protein